MLPALIAFGLGAAGGYYENKNALKEKRDKQARNSTAIAQAAGLDTKQIPGLAGALADADDPNAIIQQLMDNPMTPELPGMQKARDEMAAKQARGGLAAARPLMGNLSDAQGIGAGYNAYMQAQQGGLDAQTIASNLSANNPDMAARQAQLQQREDILWQQQQADRAAQLQQATVDQAVAMGATNSTLREMGQGVGVVQDMRTLMDNVGQETLPTAARGAMRGLRFRALNMIARTTEAGALQQAEIELFNSIIPEGDAWTGLSQQEQYARLNQLEYWFTQKLENEMIAQGLDPQQAGDYLQFGREYDDILGQVPGGSVEGLPDPGSYEAPQDQPTIPGTGIPLPRMF